jgi:hypothetical protein
MEGQTYLFLNAKDRVEIVSRWYSSLPKCIFPAGFKIPEDLYFYVTNCYIKFRNDEFVIETTTKSKTSACESKLGFTYDNSKECAECFDRIREDKMCKTCGRCLYCPKHMRPCPFCK